MLAKTRKEKVSGSTENAKVVLDLDELIPKPVAFILDGKTHIVRPVSMEAFATTYQILSDIDADIKRKGLEGDVMNERYASAFESVVPTMTKEVFSKMVKSQREAFFIFIFQILSGEAFEMPSLEESKKKTLN